MQRQRCGGRVLTLLFHHIHEHVGCSIVLACRQRTLPLALRPQRTTQGSNVSSNVSTTLSVCASSALTAIEVGGSAAGLVFNCVDARELRSCGVQKGSKECGMDSRLYLCSREEKNAGESRVWECYLKLERLSLQPVRVVKVNGHA